MRKRQKKKGIRKKVFTLTFQNGSSITWHNVVVREKKPYLGCTEIEFSGFFKKGLLNV